MIYLNFKFYLYWLGHWLTPVFMAIPVSNPRSYKHVCSSDSDITIYNCWIQYRNRPGGKNIYTIIPLLWTFCLNTFACVLMWLGCNSPFVFTCPSYLRHSYWGNPYKSMQARPARKLLNMWGPLLVLVVLSVASLFIISRFSSYLQYIIN